LSRHKGFLVKAFRRYFQLRGIPMPVQPLRAVRFEPTVRSNNPRQSVGDLSPSLGMRAAGRQA
jgi:hypothetical protein